MLSFGPDPKRLSLKDGETADGTLGGAVGVIQPRKGFRFSIDAIFLARFATDCFGGQRAVDLCAGSGVVGLCLLALGGANEVAGVELSGQFVDMARRSAHWNGCDGRASFIELDLKNVGAELPGASADLVVCNPPFMPVGHGHPPKDPGLYQARHEVKMSLGDALAAGAHLLVKGGAFCAVYPAKRLAKLVCEFKAASLEPSALMLLHPREGEEANLALLGGVKGGKEGLTVLPPVFLHPREEGAKYTEEAQAILGRPLEMPF